MRKYWAYKCREQSEEECTKASSRYCGTNWEAVRQKKMDDVNIDYEVTEPYEAKNDRDAQTKADLHWEELTKHK